MAQQLSRMQFLRGDIRGNYSPKRPPWALVEQAFVERCTRCENCIEICPEKIIQKGRGGFPVIDFSLSGCSFCEKCLGSCEPGALIKQQTQKNKNNSNNIPQQTEAENTDTNDILPWKLKAVIQPACLSLHGIVCRTCGDACEEEAIRFKLELGGVARPLLDNDNCTGCGYCYSLCPVKAIEIKSITPQAA